MSRLECPRCGRENTTVIRHGKKEIELLCMSCGEFVTVVKKNKMKIEAANPGTFDDDPSFD